MKSLVNTHYHHTSVGRTTTTMVVVEVVLIYPSVPALLHLSFSLSVALDAAIVAAATVSCATGVSAL